MSVVVCCNYTGYKTHRLWCGQYTGARNAQDMGQDDEQCGFGAQTTVFGAIVHGNESHSRFQKPFRRCTMRRNTVHRALAHGHEKQSRF